MDSVDGRIQLLLVSRINPKGLAMLRFTFRAIAVLFTVADLSADAHAVDIKPATPTLDSFVYNFSQNMTVIKLSVSKIGNVSYTHNQNRTDGFNTTKTFTIPEKDAIELLSGLIEDGLLDLEEHFPNARGDSPPFIH